MRLFFAVELDTTTRKSLTLFIKKLQKQPWARFVRWVHPENLHITLRFIGNCAAEKVPNLIQQITSTSKNHQPLLITLAGLKLFPSPSHPHVLAVMIHPNPELFALVDTIEQTLVNNDFPHESRTFLPHLSLGRLNRKITIDASLKFEETAFTLDYFTLMQSIEQEGKRVYSVLQKIMLKGEQYA